MFITENAQKGIHFWDAVSSTNQKRFKLRQSSEKDSEEEEWTLPQPAKKMIIKSNRVLVPIHDLTGP